MAKFQKFVGKWALQMWSSWNLIKIYNMVRLKYQYLLARKSYLFQKSRMDMYSILVRNIFSMNQLVTFVVSRITIIINSIIIHQSSQRSYRLFLKNLLIHPLISFIQSIIKWSIRFLKLLLWSKLFMKVQVKMRAHILENWRMGSRLLS